MAGADTGRAPNSADPTRNQVLPAAVASRQSPLIPIEQSGKAR